MATNRDKDKDDLKEMYDMDIDRVDAVTEPATGLRFLVVKAVDGEGPSLEDLLDQARRGVTKAEDGGKDDGGESEREKLHEEAEKRSKKYGIEFKEGKGHLTPPAGKPKDPEQYGDPVNYAYPIDEEHIRPAVAYFNHDGQREAGGYSEKEWEIIGKRIAAAANRYLGEGYKYEDGKIVTPNNQDDGKGETKKAEDGGEDDNLAQQLTAPANQTDGYAPGSPAWERDDAEMMQRAVAGLLAVKELVEAVSARELVEARTVDSGDWDQYETLQNAIDAITFALKEIAGAAVIEGQEAQKGDGDDVTNSVTKAGRVMSKANMQKVHQAMTHIANAAGFKTIKDFHEACKSMGICDDDEDRQDEKKGEHQDDDAQKNRKPDDEGKGEHKGEMDDADKSRRKTDGEKVDEDNPDDADKSRTMKSAVGESPAAEAVIKALEATGLTALAKSAGDLLEAAKVIKSLEERVKALEEQPMPGGPMLRGAANIRQHDYYLVRKGDAPDLNDTQVLEQAIQQVQSPYIRDILSREAARRLHPAMQSQG